MIKSFTHYSVLGSNKNRSTYIEKVIDRLLLVEENKSIAQLLVIKNSKKKKNQLF
jgi:hypothetical protein